MNPFGAKLLIGETPPIFIAEVALRIVFLYAVLVIAMRLMGRRMSSQLSSAELLAMVALAGAIGPAVQDPKRGLLPPLLSALLIVLIQRLQARLTLVSDRFERFFQGEEALLVEDGRLQLPALRDAAISRERLFAELRSKGLYSLGSVERVYLEANGSFCVLLRDAPAPGLSLIPSWDEDLRAEQPTLADTLACGSCGVVADEADGTRPCSRCAHEQWTYAVRPGALLERGTGSG